jgi:integrase
MSEDAAALVSIRNGNNPAEGSRTPILHVMTEADPLGIQPARAVIELGFGVLVYPPEAGGEAWRAVFTENGQRKFRQGATEAKLATKLAKVIERLSAGAGNMERPGADLIEHYLDPGRLPAQDQWSRKHAHTQRRLCERFAAPVIAAVTCQDITTWQTQQIVNAAPTAGEGDRVRGMLSALVAAGIEGGYLTNPRLAMVHWQAKGRPLPAPQVSVAGESGLWVDPAEIPADDDIGKLGQALAAGWHGDRDELMASTAAYSGLRWGELTALTIPQIDQAGRVITVDRQVIEVAGHLYLEPPKCRKSRKTIYPRLTPSGYPLAERLAARAEAACAEQKAGVNPLGLIFPSRGSSCGGRATSTATSSSEATPQPDGVTARVTAGGPGIACGTCSAPPPCSPGSSTPPTCPAWPATPTSAPPC